MSQDEYYQDRARRLDTLAGPENAAYWMMLTRLSNEWRPSAAIPFSDWCEQFHGFRPQYDDAGGIAGRPEVVDDKKYTLCLLKYSG